MAERLEQVSDVFFRFVLRDVLHINVVDQTSERSAIFWLKFHGQDTFLALSLESSLGTLLFLEANEAIAS